jgi:uncharacterized protein
VSGLRISKSFTLPIEAATQTFAILGKRGVGKTNTAVVMAEELLRARQPIVIVDPVGVWWGLRSSADGKSEGFPIVVLGGEHADAPLEVTGGELVADMIVSEGLSVVLDLSLFRKGDMVRFMTDFAEALYRKNRNALHVILDEADAFAPQKPFAGQERLLGAIEDIVRRGRARGLGVTMITQRPAVLNKNVLTQIEVLVTMRLTAPHDHDAIKAWVESHGTPEEQKTLIASLPALPIGTAWFWSPGWLDVFEKVAVRARTTFDSSATPKVGQAKVQPKRLAPVDLEKLKTRMAETLERTKADDPRELKKRIVELERQSQAAAAKAIAQQVDGKAIERAFKEGKEAMAKSLQDVMREIVAFEKGLTSQLDRLRKVISDLPAEVKKAREAKLEVSEKPQPLPFKFRQPAVRLSADAGSSLPVGEKAVLIVCAQYRDGADRKQISILTGYKRSSRDAYVKRLSTKGLVEVDGKIRATDAGIAALGNDFEPLPTGQALQDYWLGRLPEGEMVILSHLIKAYPNAMRRADLDSKTGYKRSSRDAYIKRLKAKQLVDASGAGDVRASEVLFG